MVGGRRQGATLANSMALKALSAKGSLNISANIKRVSGMAKWA